MALKSKAVSRDWEIVSRLLENSLRSAYNQIDPDFKIIVVCHETPRLQHRYDRRVEIINVDFAPPVQAITKLTMQDKWQKLAIGTVRARELKPDFIMIMDADDLVHKNLADYANSHQQENGWIFKQGYRYSYGSKWIYLDKNFNCGTNAIVSSKLIDFPRNLEPEEIAKCSILRHGHTVIEEYFKTINKPLQPLPFCGAMYVYNHGDNDSGDRDGSIKQFFRKLPGMRLLTNQIKKEFSLNL